MRSLPTVLWAVPQHTHFPRGEQESAWPKAGWSSWGSAKAAWSLGPHPWGGRDPGRQAGGMPRKGQCSERLGMPCPFPQASWLWLGRAAGVGTGRMSTSRWYSSGRALASLLNYSCCHPPGPSAPGLAWRLPLGPRPAPLTPAQLQVAHSLLLAGGRMPMLWQFPSSPRKRPDSW